MRFDVQFALGVPVVDFVAPIAPFVPNVYLGRGWSVIYTIDFRTETARFSVPCVKDTRVVVRLDGERNAVDMQLFG